MKQLLVVMLLLVLMISCDESRFYEQYTDFEERFWPVSEKPRFEFEITDTQTPYTLYCNVRNAESYPFADFRYTYQFTDSTGKVIDGKLMTAYLFDKKSGKPFGESGLGDIYDHQFPIIKNYKFTSPGKYAVTFEQFMRADTLAGVLAVGLRVERDSK